MVHLETRCTNARVAGVALSSKKIVRGTIDLDAPDLVWRRANDLRGRQSVPRWKRGGEGDTARAQGRDA